MPLPRMGHLAGEFGGSQQNIAVALTASVVKTISVAAKPLQERYPRSNISTCQRAKSGAAGFWGTKTVKRKLLSFPVGGATIPQSPSDVVPWRMSRFERLACVKDAKLRADGRS